MKDFDSKLNSFFAQFDTRLQEYVPNMVAETAVENFQNAFITKSWDSEPWMPYKNKAREPKRGSLMMRSNALFRSVKPSLVIPDRVVISAGNSRVPYARIHNEGDLVSGMRQIKPYVNRNFMGKGKPVAIRAHSRSVNYIMPKRQFMGKSQSLLNDIKSRFKETLKNR